MSLHVKATLESIDVPADHNEVIEASLKVDVEFASGQALNKVWLILVADKSGSMSGNPWKQVNSALLYMLSESYTTYTNITTDIIVYNSVAQKLQCEARNYEAVVNAERASGMTNFSSAYNMIAETLKSKQVGEDTDIVIVFLTDGDDTSKIDPAPALKNLKFVIENLPCAAVVHSVGFTKDHKFDVLNELRMIGKEKGVFQYAEPSDGPDALQKKLEGIFNYVSLSGSKVEIQLNLEGHCFIGLNTKPVKEKNAIVRLEKDGTLSLMYSVIREGANEVRNEKPTLNFTLVENGIPHSAQTTAIQKVTSGHVAVIKYKLRKFDQSLQDVVEKLTSHITPPNDVERNEYLEILKRVQQGLKEFDGPAVFRLPRDEREPIIGQVQAMHARLGQLFETIAQWARGQWTTVNRARLADIAYSNVFTKANRQRRMDARVATNAQRLKEDSAKLEALNVDMEKLGEVSEESTSLFYCVLSLCNWVELTQGKDGIGFGLAVLRPEWVVDDPTQIRVYNISTTVCAKSAIEDSIKYSIDVQGQVATTGGFGIGQEVGVATRGSGREPINAWLPLYIHPQHWEVIRINLRQILGYFVSLDPLGFALEQVDSLFLVLGTMISRLTPTPGERQLQILFQFMRTCIAVADEMKWYDRIEEKLVNTIEKIHYDVTDQAKNILVLIGYIVVLPSKRLQNVFKNKNSLSNLWTAIMAIAARRSAFTMFNDLSEVHVRLFLDQLLYGSPVQYKPEGSLSVAQEITNMFGLSNAEDLSALLQFENAFDGAQMPAHAQGAMAQFSKAMTRYGYPTISALYSSLSFFFAWSDLNSKNSADPSVSMLTEMDALGGVPPMKWLTEFKIYFDSAYGANLAAPDIMSYFGLLHSRCPLPHPADQLARAVVAQGVQYRVNKPAKEAFESGVYMNTIEDPHKCILSLHSSLVQQRKFAFHSLAAAQKFQAMTASTVAQNDVKLYVQDLANLLSGSRRTVAFKAVHKALQKWNAPKTVPFAEFKLRVLITGKYVDTDSDGKLVERNVLDSGQTWIPGRTYNRIFCEVYGRAEITAIINMSIANDVRVWGR